jgi:hypothetical protein
MRIIATKKQRALLDKEDDKELVLFENAGNAWRCRSVCKVTTGKLESKNQRRNNTELPGRISVNLYTLFMNVFKYVTPERTDVLENQHIRFSQVQYLNDPFEFLPVISRIMDKGDAEHMYEKYLAQGISGAENNKIDIEEISREIPEEIFAMIPPQMLEQISKMTIAQGLAMMPGFHPKNLVPTIFSLSGAESGVNYSTTIRNSWQDRFGVLSLAQVCDNITMWSHYSKDHSGFVIEFNSENEFFNRRKKPHDPIRCLHEVKYETVRPDIKLYNRELSEDEMLNYLAEKILLTKSIHWAYEQELRIILPLDETAKMIEKENQRIHLHYFESSVIKAVYLGVNASETTHKQLTTILSQPRYQHVTLHHGSLNPTHYKIDFTPVSAG